jgi:hypothetical protein
MGGERKSALTGQAGDQLISGLKFGPGAVECVPNRLGAAAEMTREKRFHHSTGCQAVFLSIKTVAFTHKRTNHELIRPCARYRAQPPRPVRPFPRVKGALGLALAKSRRSSMRFVPENQVRTRLPAGGRWIRTIGPWRVSTNYRCHRLCHLQMSLGSGGGRARSPGVAQRPTGDRLTGA